VGTPKKLATATELQFPRNVIDFKQTTGSRVANFNFVHLSSAMSDNNTDPVIIWW
jgi:hypothetical protein